MQNYRNFGDADYAITVGVAAQVGLPTSADDPFGNGGLIQLNKPAAAHVLAVAGVTSLAYGDPSPPTHQVDEASKALSDLSEEAAFMSNGRWEAGASQHWNPFTSATFDCGVIGFDAENAFIFWVEEED